MQSKDFSQVRFLFIYSFIFTEVSHVAMYRAMYASECGEAKQLSNATELIPLTISADVIRVNHVLHFQALFLLHFAPCNVQNSGNHKRAGFNQVSCSLLNPSNS